MEYGLNGKGGVGKVQGVSCDAGIQEQSVSFHFHNTQETPRMTPTPREPSLGKEEEHPSTESLQEAWERPGCQGRGFSAFTAL